MVSVSVNSDVDGDSADSLANDLEQLDITRSSKLWTVGWDSVVTIVDVPENGDQNKVVRTVSACDMWQQASIH